MNKDILKIAVIGASYVGKSTLCYALSNRPISGEYTSTIGIDYILNRVSNNVSIGFWDLAGLERFTSIVSIYVKSSNQAIFCYSAESYQSYLDMIDKYEFYKTHNYLDNKPIFVVATKIESKNAHPEYKEWCKNFIQQNNFQFIPTSSYTGKGLDDLTNTLVGTTKCTLIDLHIPEASFPIIIKKEPKSQKYFRC